MILLNKINDGKQHSIRSQFRSVTATIMITKATTATTTPALALTTKIAALTSSNGLKIATIVNDMSAKINQSSFNRIGELLIELLNNFIRNFVINYFFHGLLLPMPPQRCYAIHYHFISQEYRQTIIKSGISDNICPRDENFFNVPCDMWDKCQILLDDTNGDVILSNYLNKNAILSGMEIILLILDFLHMVLK